MGLPATTLATSTGMSFDLLVNYPDWMSDKWFVKFNSNDEVLLTKLGNETYDRLVYWILHYVGKFRFPQFID